MKLITFLAVFGNCSNKIPLIPRFCLFSLFTASLLGFNSAVDAREFQDIEKIRQAAKIFLEEKQVAADKVNTEITIGQIDPRMRLAKCSSEIEAFLPQTSRRTGKTTVGIRCGGPITWKIFVSAKITQYQEVWVLNRNVASGELISQSDLTKSRVEILNVRKIPMTDLNQIINASPRRTMRAGATIFQDSVCLVCRGDKVTVTAKNDFLSINVEGVALSNAVLGEVAQVRNSSSRKTFGATVVGKNQLNVTIAGSN
ncbi:flagellar basal body P-ring formation protein FlgA [Aliikangiella marina]|uniref:Flagella basal body P-ring formation protein FlgA n=1 Tax=Aliikangiella marina TaxID=1712262 RepID=A0A545TDK6_9GAMM|nr:flagellar basal body P-ring formation chaperone FlgA [Aliikangiella marina]TQV75299.1 flagellar basal body P-ring formation protein FlgA [Aliikangiella marina]